MVIIINPSFKGASKSSVCSTDFCPCWKRKYTVPTRQFGSLISPGLYRLHHTRQSKVCDSRHGFPCKLSPRTNVNASSLALSLFGVGVSSFQSPRSPVLCFFYILLTSSIFHVLITISSSVILSTWPNHLSLASLIFSLVFATPACKRKRKQPGYL